MSLSMHSASVPIFVRTLESMLGWLDKAEAFADRFLVGLSEVGCIITSGVLIAQQSPVHIRGSVIGIFNLVYVIPSQTLFAEVTPAGMMGRVIAIRSRLAKAGR